MSRFQNLSLSLLATCALLAPQTAQATFAVQPSPKAEDQAFERLPDLSVIRGARLPLKALHVTADAGETWTSSIAYDLGADWIQLDPDNGVSDALIHMHIDALAMTGDGPYSATITFTPDVGAPVQVPVQISVWPKAQQSMTAAELANHDNWPSDSSYPGSWIKWGFLPNPDSHQPSSADDPPVGANVDSWEKTPCPEGGPYDDSCTRPGQAGLASGMSVDAAWLLSTGDPRVLVAVLDSGIRWGEFDLVTQFALNAAELSTCAPLGAEGNNFDVNQDGIFNIRDYDGDGYMDVNGNGFLDPQDLIYGQNPETGIGCSDGVDSDNNGYVDDICGWDFFFNDNDASDDANFGHGTGEAKDSVAAGHNGIGDIGICPRCRLLPVRVGDSFIVDVNQFAEGVIFSVDSGAKVVQEALGSINSTTFMQGAIDYAYEKGVSIVASAADETSYHHNYPGNAEHTLYVHAVVYDTDGEGHSPWKRASTFLNYGNCTNHGGHLVLSTPGTGCSSEATGNTSGQAGLVYSYFVQMQDGQDEYYNKPLSTEEAYQIMYQSADDIDVPTDDFMDDTVLGQDCNVNQDCAMPWYACYTGLDPADETHQTFASSCGSTKYPSGPGWDQYFGYGRNNARRSLELIRDKRIPPAVDITTPRWFEIVDPMQSPQLGITGSVDSSRYPIVDWRLEWGKGIQPTDAEFQTLATGTVSQDSPLHNVELGSLDTQAIFADPSAVVVGKDDFTVTLRLVATASSGDSPARGVFRKTFVVHHDPDLKPGWPIFIGSGPGSGKITDLDGDGLNELILVPEDGSVHALRADGSELPGFPTAVNGYPSLDDTVCAESPARCHQQSQGYQNQDLNSIAKHSSVHAAPAIGDLANDGTRSIVVATLDGLVHVFGPDGSPRPGFPVGMDPSHLAEFEGGKYQPDGQRFAEGGLFSAPVLADLDADGDLEIIAAGMDQWVYAWHHDGSQVTGWPVLCRNENYPAGTDNGERMDGRIVSTPAVVDLDGDGKPEIAVGSNEMIEGSTAAFLYALWGDGNAHEGGAYLPNWPRSVIGFVPGEVLPFVGRGLPNSPAAADIDGDGKQEIVVAGMGGNVSKFGIDGPHGYLPILSSSSEYYGRKANTKELITLPLINDPSIADLDVNGKLDVIDGTAGTGLVRVASEGGRRAAYDHSVSAWDLDSGYFLEGFPQKVADFQFFMNYAVADIDGDGLPEALSSGGGYFVTAFNHEGVQPSGWPKYTSQWSTSTPAVGDLDSDGLIDVVVGTREGWLYIWSTKGPIVAPHGSMYPSIQWASFHHDDHNSGNWNTPLPYTIAGPAEVDPGCACTCSQSHSNPSQVFWTGLMALAMIVWRRRQG